MRHFPYLLGAVEVIPGYFDLMGSSVLIYPYVMLLFVMLHKDYTNQSMCTEGVSLSFSGVEYPVLEKIICFGQRITLSTNTYIFKALLLKRNEIFSYIIFIL